jgi:hypothetical protein
MSDFIDEMVADNARQVVRLKSALAVEHEMQRAMLERLGIEWPPGEPFVAVVEAEINNLRIRVEGQAYWRDKAEKLQVEDGGAPEIVRLRTVFANAKAAVEKDLMAALEAVGKNDPEDESEVAELIRCHLDRWAGWGPSRLHIKLDP